MTDAHHRGTTAKRWSQAGRLLAIRNIVNGLLVEKGAVLLARRSPFRPSYPGLWSFPGGHVEHGETLLEALKRELREEIDVEPIAARLIATIRDPNSRPSDRIDYHMFAVTRWTNAEPKMLGDEHSELEWFLLAQAETLPDLALEEYRPLFALLAAA